MKRPTKQTSGTGVHSAPESRSAAVNALNRTVRPGGTTGARRRQQTPGVGESRPRGRGRRSVEIVDGIETTRFPECCLVGRRREDGNLEWFGSGVLIHSRIVLTAAHLVHSQPDVVAIRAIDRDLEGAEILDGIFVPHPQHQLDFTHRDLALVFLASPSSTKVAAIASAAELHAATAVVLVGFGDNNSTGTAGFGIKREGTVPITAIRRDAETDLSESELAFDFDATHEFVSGGNGVGVCDGDSGGPAYITTTDGAMEIAGIAARRVPGPGNLCGLGTITTRVDVFMDFIASQAAARGIQLDQ